MPPRAFSTAGEQRGERRPGAQAYGRWRKFFMNRERNAGGCGRWSPQGLCPSRIIRSFQGELRMARELLCN